MVWWLQGILQKTQAWYIRCGTMLRQFCYPLLEFLGTPTYLCTFLHTYK